MKTNLFFRILIITILVYQNGIGQYSFKKGTSLKSELIDNKTCLLPPHLSEKFRDQEIDYERSLLSYDTPTTAWVAHYASGLVPSYAYAKDIAIDANGNVYVTGYSDSSFTGDDYVTIKYNSSGVQQWVARYNGPGNYTDRATSISIDNLGNIYVTGYSYGSGSSDDIATIKYNSSGDIHWVARYNGPGNSQDVANSISVDKSGNVYVTGYSYTSSTGYDYITIKYNSAGIEEWVAIYDGLVSGEDCAISIAVDDSGNVYITGYSASSTSYPYNYDYATIKYNSLGVQQWVSRYNGTGNDCDEANSIAIDNSGNVYVTGYSTSSSTSWDYATIKYNNSGVQQWVARYNGPGNSLDAANCIFIDKLGNIYVTGRSTGIGTNLDYATVKYNSSGIQQWVARYNGTGNDDDEATSLSVDNLGNVYVTGSSKYSDTFYDYATVKYNSLGVQQWVVRYNGPGNSYDYANAIKVDGVGNVYVVGYSWNSGVYNDNDYATLKYNSSGELQWVTRYDGTGNSLDQATSIAVDNSGNVYVTGYSYNPATKYDYATVKYNASGIKQWVTRYNGPGNDNDKASSIFVDNLGNVYVTGSSYGAGTNYDYLTIKYNSSGVQQWMARYNGPGNFEDHATSISVDNLGNVYVTGYSYGSGTGFDYATIKYDSSGNQKWVARYNGPGNGEDNATSMVIDHLGNVYVTGYSKPLNTHSDYATIKYNTFGEVQWIARYNGPLDSIDIATSITIDNLGNVYVTGKSFGLGTGYDYATIKYNVIGEVKWLARYNGPGNSWDEATSVSVDNFGNVYVTGYSYGIETSYDFATLKYNSLGEVQWLARYNGPKNGADYARTISIDGSGGVYVTGYGAASDGYDDFITIKYNSVGEVKWLATYTGSARSDDRAQDIFIDNSNNVYVTGYCLSLSKSVYTIIKYSQIFVSVNEQPELLPEQYSLSQNYPNPFNPVTTIKYQLPVNSKVTLKIYNIFGQEIKTLVDEIQEAGYKSVEWNSTNNAGDVVSSGVYFYRIEATSISEQTKSYTQVRKMVLLR